MERIKVKQDDFQNDLKGIVLFEIPGKKVSYMGIIGKLNEFNTYVPKIFMHEKSWWRIIGIRNWMDRYTLFYGNEIQTESEARKFIENVHTRLAVGESIDAVAAEGFQKAFVFED